MSLIALERAIWNLKIKLEPAILFANGGDAANLLI